MSGLLNFQLAQYEGPLDLLLDLIRKQQINIYDIPIASITAQYLSYVENARALDIELSSEFVYMAATLIHIKSKMLLPADPELARLEGEPVDPRQELVNRLIEHERFKNAAEMLQQKRMIEEASWSNPQLAQFLGEDDEPRLAVTLFELTKVFQAVLARAGSRPVLEFDQDDVSVPRMLSFLRDELGRLPDEGFLPVSELLERQRSRKAVVCLFLALLELVKRQAVALEQDSAFAEIAVRRREAFAHAFAADLAAVEREYH